MTASRLLSFLLIFSIACRSINAQTLSGCGSNDYKYRSGSSGTIQSKNYPSNYEDNLNCAWSIDSGDIYSNTRLSFASLFRTEGSTTDYIKIYKGSSASGTYIKKYGSTRPSDIIIQGSRVYITFRSDSSSVYSGFQLQWSRTTSTSTTCSGTAYKSGSSGTIKSPNWPSSYPSSLSCYWYITGTSGKDLQFTFSSTFRLESSTTSCYDYLNIYRGHSSTTFIAKLCGSTTPSTIRVQGNLAKLYFYTDSSGNSYSGFSVTWLSTYTPSSTTNYYTNSGYYFYGYSSYRSSSYYSSYSYYTRLYSYYTRQYSYYTRLYSYYTRLSSYTRLYSYTSRVRTYTYTYRSYSSCSSFAIFFGCPATALKANTTTLVVVFLASLFLKKLIK